MKLKELVSRGLWPYSGDPSPIGLQVIGDPGNDAPLLLIGNSRHTLERCRRLFWPKGVRILALDTGGLSLGEAMVDGRLTAETITDGLKGLSNYGQTHQSGQYCS